MSYLPDEALVRRALRDYQLTTRVSRAPWIVAGPLPEHATSGREALLSGRATKLRTTAAVGVASALLVAPAASASTPPAAMGIPEDQPTPAMGIPEDQPAPASTHDEPLSSGASVSPTLGGAAPFVPRSAAFSPSTLTSSEQEEPDASGIPSSDPQAAELVPAETGEELQQAVQEPAPTPTPEPAEQVAPEPAEQATPEVTPAPDQEPASDAETDSGTPMAAPTIVSDETSATPALGWSYEVQAGDSLWRVGERLEQDASPARVDRTWRVLYQVNKQVIGSNPDIIHPGQVLEIPVNAVQVLGGEPG